MSARGRRQLVRSLPPRLKRSVSGDIHPLTSAVDRRLVIVAGRPAAIRRAFEPLVNHRQLTTRKPASSRGTTSCRVRGLAVETLSLAPRVVRAASRAPPAPPAPRRRSLGVG